MTLNKVLGVIDEYANVIIKGKNSDALLDTIEHDALRFTATRDYWTLKNKIVSGLEADGSYIVIEILD